MKKAVLLLVGFTPLFLFAQIKNVADQLIVQLQPNVSVEEVLIEIYGANKTEGNLTIERQLSVNLNVWLIELNGQSKDRVKTDFEKSDGVIFVQNNQLIERRLSPNDASYSDLWHFNNTGSNGPGNITALAGADVDAEKAWDLTTGGTTKKGDDVVICVIDDGIDEDHEDIIDNLWVNHNEIPGNGIDDDNNGYIDDINGWNTYGNNGNMTDSNTGNIGSHGTRVSGIVGAKGNNSIGVTGVNWDVKLMTVVGGGDQADAIAAYDYPLTMRKLYNQTNGAKGAYVVSTNASWGTDFGKPEDAPIWCAMYDSLGKAGVLNAAATSNAAIDVDAVGDLPTTCPSLYLIGVTNTMADDNLAVAGFGQKNIDLAAPGEGIKSTYLGNGYGSDEGTSYASPMVAGAVGLIYSYACEEFIELSKSNPEEAAKIARYVILEGTDKLSSLTGKTLTGGRLNLYETLREVEKQCWTLTSLEELTISDSRPLSVYPNPVSNQFTVEFPMEASYQWEILDLSGKRIKGGDFYGSSIHIKGRFASGIYFIKILNETKGETITEKFVVNQD